MSMTETDDPPPVQTLATSSTPIVVSITGFVLIFVVSGFFSFFFCRCFLKKILLAWDFWQNPSSELDRPADPSTEKPGLDPKIVGTFLVFPYLLVRDQAMECSICLSELSDEYTVRFITPCHHAFHTDCIDLWFESHKTCPVCRYELELDRASPEKSPFLPGINLIRSGSHESFHDSVMIIVQEDVTVRNGEDHVCN
ncbi:PREDICTED: RING-H2 finger protein ATL81-like [Tarenaya hassleriana]|uniref:RING-H2 finger protein ATL81-like n=1 Tax=Tarenaya hassleriana TaxID=28532 RepID=UPI00053C5685|nr:PREDICTED: RING-H2 finger protein ATL81-like [Tarenaya hassleriana]